jgi:hypothetical protein
MFTVTQLYNWSVLHFKAGYWYIDCRKTLCLEDEEDVKKSFIQAKPRGAKSGSNIGNDHDGHVEEEEDLSLLLEKERNKTLAKVT